MANDINGPLRNVLPGNIDQWNRVYATVADANAAIPSTVVGGRNFREGKVVQIGTVTDFEEHHWFGGFDDVNLVPKVDLEPLATKEEFDPVKQKTLSFEIDSQGNFNIVDPLRNIGLQLTKDGVVNLFSLNANNITLDGEPLVLTDFLRETDQFVSSLRDLDTAIRPSLVNGNFAIIDQNRNIGALLDALGVWNVVATKSKTVNDVEFKKVNGWAFVVTDINGWVIFGIKNDRTIVADFMSELPVKTAIQTIQPATIYTTCNDISAWSQSMRGNSLNLYVERMLKLTKKQYTALESTNGLTRTLASRRYFHPEPGGNPANQNNYRENIHIETITDRIIGETVIPTEISFSHVSTLASLSNAKKLKVICIGDSTVAGSEASTNAPATTSPYTFWQYLKYFFELDKIEAGGGHDCLVVGTKNVRNFTASLNGTTNNIRAGAEGYSGWTTRQLLYDRTFAQGNIFYDADKAGTVKFSLAKALSRYRTMTDEGVRLSNSDPAKGTEVTDTTPFDFCTPNVVVIQLGFNDDSTYRVIDAPLLIAAIKSEYPNMIIALSFIDASGSYYPELWPGWQGAEKDISFLTQMDVNQGFGYNKRLHDKSFNEYNAIKVLHDPANKVFFVNNNMIQPTAGSVGYRVQSEPGGQIMYQPYAWSSYAYHPNNTGHACWGYHWYSFMKYICAMNYV